MHNKYKVLAFQDLDRNTLLYRPLHMLPNSVINGDPAILVMTDLKRVTPITIEASASIVDANEKMKTCGVRLLFVVDDSHGLVGLITSTDILGEKPVLYINEHGGKREEILVSDIMQKRDNIDAISLGDVARSTVGDIVETLRDIGRQHVLVVEQSHDGLQRIRGIISSTQVERQLGEPIVPSERAHSFAEIEQALMATA